MNLIFINDWIIYEIFIVKKYFELLWLKQGKQSFPIYRFSPFHASSGVFAAGITATAHTLSSGMAQTGSRVELVKRLAAAIFGVTAARAWMVPPAGDDTYHLSICDLDFQCIGWGNLHPVFGRPFI